MHIMLSIGILPSSGFGQGSAVGLRAASLRSGLRPAMSADDALGNQFWSSKTAATRFKLNLELSALDEMQEREQMFMTFLQKEHENTRLLEAQLEETKRQLSAAPVAPALAAAESPAAALAPAGTAANADEVTSLKAELKAMHEKVAEVEMKREVEVQQVAAFWLAKLARAGEKAAGAAPPAPPPAPPPSPPEPMIKRSDLDAVAQERIAALENEIDTLEADYDTITDRLEVQAETIMLANTRLDEVAAALEAQAAKAEEQLQRTAAFWIERNAALKAEAQSLREAFEAAKQEAGTGKGKKQKSKAKADRDGKGSGEGDGQAVAELRAELDEALLSLDAEKLKGERALQQTSAYWIDRLKSAKAKAAAAIAASEAEKSAQKSLAELRLADGSDAAANELRKAHAEEMAAAAMRAERELQAASAFWVARLQAAKAAKKKK